jgi:hypothetical protein
LLALVGLLGAASAEAASYPETVLADKPIAYYRFEESLDLGSIVDSSESGAYPGTINFDDLVAWPKLQQPGVSSNSIGFHLYETQKSFVSIPDRFSYNPDLNKPGPFTAEAWVRPTSDGADYRSPVCNFGGWGDASGWHFYQTPGGSSVSQWIWVQKGGGIWVGGVPIRKNQWDHLVATFDGTTVSFYVNGVFSGSANASTALPNSGQPFCIGGSPAGNWWFDGNVDDVAIYTNALTVAQIQTHYQVGLTNFYSGPIGAYVSSDPAAATSFAGRSVSFVVGADGSSPLAYQWYKGNTPLAGETSDTLKFLAAYTDNNAMYHAVVTNAYGAATSAPAQLTVSTELSLSSSPASIARTAGSKAAFIGVPGGAMPFSYQWYKGAAPIVGATNETLWLSDIKLTDDGSTYYVRINNPWFTTNSEPATLSVLARTTVVPITGYAKIVMAESPVAYWRLDEPEGSTVAVDAAGSFDGTYDTVGAGTFAPGIFTYDAGSGIPAETNKAVVITNGARIKIPYALELNPHGPFTAEAWINPSSLAGDPQDYRTIFSSMGSGPTGWLFYQQPNNTFAWVVFNDNWVSSFIGDPVDTVAANTWYHLVLTYDGALFHIYVNGRHAVSQPYDIFIPNRDGATHLGWRSDNGFNPFAGIVDDVAFYNKALTLEQIQGHYGATVRLGANRTGNNLVLSWTLGTLQEADGVTGTYTDLPTATSPYTAPIGGAAKYYRVKVQ